MASAPTTEASNWTASCATGMRSFAVTGPPPQQRWRAATEAGAGAPVAVVTTVQGIAPRRPLICLLGRMVESADSARAVP